MEPSLNPSRNAGHQPNQSLTFSRMSLIMSGRSGSAHSPVIIISPGESVFPNSPKSTWGKENKIKIDDRSKLCIVKVTCTVQI